MALLTGIVSGSMAAQAQPVSGIIASEQWGKVWECTPNIKIMREAKVPSEKIPEVGISAARNEYEPFQVVLTPNRDLKNVRVVAHTLVGPDGEIIEGWNVVVRNEVYMNVTQPTFEGLKPGLYPDPLPEFTPFTATKGVNNPVWVTVYVAPGKKPGNYRGSVDITADGIKKISVPVRLHVWAFELPSVSKLKTSYGRYMDEPIRYSGAKTLEEKRKLVELYNIDFWHHRVAPTQPYDFYDIKTDVQDGQVKVDFSDFDIAVQKFFPLFNSFSFPYKALKGASDDDTQKLRVEYMRTVAEHLADKGQIDKNYLYIFDEPSHDQYPAIRNASETAKMADARIKFLLTEKIVPELFGYVDIWAPIMNNYNEADARARQAAGDQVWWYVCCNPHNPYPNNFIEYPSISPRILHWVTWNEKVDGVLYYQATWWRGVNPWEDPMSVNENGTSKWGNGDGRLVYPPERKPSDKFIAKGPVPSIRWEMIREGMEDYDYFYILRSLIEKRKASGGADDAVKNGEEALAMVEACAKSPTDYTLDPAQLEQARAKVAEAIERLE
jgi:hypothetical protein